MQNIEIDTNQLFDVPEGMILDEFVLDGRKICVVADIVKQGQDMFMEEVIENGEQVLKTLSLEDAVAAEKKYSELKEIF